MDAPFSSSVRLQKCKKYLLVNMMKIMTDHLGVKDKVDHDSMSPPKFRNIY